MAATSNATAAPAAEAATSVDVVDPAGKAQGSADLPAEVFGVSAEDIQRRIPLIHQVVVAQLAAARQGTHATKTRGQVSGGGKKPFKQKGTGRARQGSTRAPHFTGGGIVHGPTPRDYGQRTPKKLKVAALRSALSDRAGNGRVHVVTGFVTSEAPSTKQAAATVASVTEGRSVLVVLARGDELSGRSLRNLPGAHVLPADQLNTYDVLTHDDVIFTRDALDAFLAPKAALAAEERDEQEASK